MIQRYKYQIAHKHENELLNESGQEAEFAEYIKLSDVLALIPDCGIGPDDCCNDCDQSNYYLSIVNEERARLRAELGDK